LRRPASSWRRVRRSSRSRAEAGAAFRFRRPVTQVLALAHLVAAARVKMQVSLMTVIRPGYLWLYASRSARSPKTTVAKTPAMVNWD
jgi:hypothetical protein